MDSSLHCQEQLAKNLESFGLEIQILWGMKVMERRIRGLDRQSPLKIKFFSSVLIYNVFRVFVLLTNVFREIFRVYISLTNVYNSWTLRMAAHETQAGWHFIFLNECMN